jgi:hypothetical protein
MNPHHPKRQLLYGCLDVEVAAARVLHMGISQIHGKFEFLFVTSKLVLLGRCI